MPTRLTQKPPQKQTLAILIRFGWSLVGTTPTTFPPPFRRGPQCFSDFFSSSFKVLNKSETGHLTVDEFMNVYEVSELKWKERKGDTGPWFNHVTIIPLRRCGEAVNRLVRLNVFKYIVFVVLIGNAVVKALADIFDKENPDLLKQVEYGFLAFYIMEASLKIFGLGPTKYFK